MEVLNKNIYKWPKELEEGRKNKELIFLPEADNLELVIGQKNVYAFSVIYSSNEMTIGKMTLPVNRYSELEIHEGDEAIYVLKGRLLVNIYSDEENTNPNLVIRSIYEINKNEKMLIPKNYKHIYKNLDEENVEAIIVVGPKL